MTGLERLGGEEEEEEEEAPRGHWVALQGQGSRGGQTHSCAFHQKEKRRFLY